MGLVNRLIEFVESYVVAERKVIHIAQRSEWHADAEARQHFLRPWLDSDVVCMLAATHAPSGGPVLQEGRLGKVAFKDRLQPGISEKNKMLGFSVDARKDRLIEA